MEGAENLHEVLKEAGIDTVKKLKTLSIEGIDRAIEKLKEAEKGKEAVAPAISAIATIAPSDAASDVETSLKSSLSEYEEALVKCIAKLNEDNDDFQSPVDPKRYIKLRVRKTLAFYQRRLPVYARRRGALRLMLLFGTVAASILARYGRSGLVVVVTSATGALISWLEFSDTARKMQRYSRAITSLERLLDWWDSIGDVERASKESIRHLVYTSETIISDERIAWVSTAQRKDEKNKSPTSAKEMERSINLYDEKREQANPTRTTSTIIE